MFNPNSANNPAASHNRASQPLERTSGEINLANDSLNVPTSKVSDPSCNVSQQLGAAIAAIKEAAHHQLARTESPVTCRDQIIEQLAKIDPERFQVKTQSFQDVVIINRGSRRENQVSARDGLLLTVTDPYGTIAEALKTDPKSAEFLSKLTDGISSVFHGYSRHGSGITIEYDGKPTWKAG